MLFRCISCNYWTKEDIEADDDVVLKTNSQDGKDAEGPEALFVADGLETSRNSPVKSNDRDLPVAGEFVGDQMTAASTNDEFPFAATSEAAVVAMPHVESLKRVEDLLTQGGLLMTQVIRDDRRLIRRLELDEKSGVVTWGIDRVMGIFGNPFEQVKLSKARIMCADKIVKIGHAGRREFFVFEACDAQEAAAVCDCLVAVAKKLQEARG